MQWGLILAVIIDFQYLKELCSFIVVGKCITIETFITDGAALAADLGGLAAFCLICSYLVKDSDLKKWILKNRKISLTEMFQVEFYANFEIQELL